ncbi:MAG: hypothetical protein QS721_01880 [Candidatus Endonucleobacter sp. (ex Gigantidas childressi)]|nr:hypothetical protein [Candidatus Endonucleobacter sp. (ex Gigantidas childressi)]
MFSSFKYSKYLKSVLFLLALVCGFSVVEAQNNTPVKAQLQQKTTEKSAKQNWFYSQFNRAAILARRCFNGTNLLRCTEYSKSNDNSISYLQCILDDNGLSVALEVFQKQNVFEVLAMVYMHVLLMVDKLDNDISKTDIEVPAWIINFRPILQEINGASDFCHIDSEKEKFKLLTIKEKTKAEDAFHARASQCHSVLQSFFPYQEPTDEFSLFKDKLHEQVSLLTSPSKNNEKLVTTETSLKSQEELLHKLLVTYMVPATSNTPSETQYPVLKALVNWAAHNTDSLISALLDDSKRWLTQGRHLTAEESKKKEISAEEQVFFTYLNYDLKDVWHDASQSLRDYEIINITNNLLAEEVIKSLTVEFTTVKQLAAAYKDGFAALNTMHSDLKQQGNLSPEEKAKKKKEKQNGSFSSADMDEYLKEGIKQNMKDSLLGKVASGICYAFNVVKSGFIATPTKQEKSKKAMADWFKLVQKNALTLKYKSENKGIQLVMAELIKIDTLHEEGDITITDALTTLVAQHFTSADKEQAFTMLTGLERKSDIIQKSYCYKPLVATDLDQAAKNHELQCETVYQSTNSSASDNNPVTHNSKSDAKNHSDWLSMSKHDYMLQNRQPQNNVADNKTELSHLHVDWCFIDLDYEEESEEQVEKQRKTVWIGFNFNPSFYGKILICSVMALSLVAIIESAPAANTAQSDLFPYDNVTQINNHQISNSSYIIEADATSYSNVIDISNVTELNLIGHHQDYLSNGSYQLTQDIYSAHSIMPISQFSGDFNGRFFTIYSIPHCLTKTLSGNGAIYNLTISNANIIDNECSAVIAGEMKDNALVSLVKIENSTLHHNSTHSDHVSVIGIVAGNMFDTSLIEQITVINSKVNITFDVNSRLHAAGVAGNMHNDSVICNILIMKANIYIKSNNKTGHWAMAGGAVGELKGNAIVQNFVARDVNIEVDNCRLACIGGVVGSIGGNNTVENITQINTNIKVTKAYAYLSWGAGFSSGESTMQHLLVVNSSISLLHNAGNIGSAAGVQASNDKKHTPNSIDNIIINSKVAILQNSDVKFNICAVILERCQCVCNMTGGVTLSKPTKIGQMNVYRYEMSNTTDKCGLLQSIFINKDCEINEELLSNYQHVIKCNRAYRVSTKPTTEPLTTEPTTEPTTESETIKAAELRTIKTTTKFITELFTIKTPTVRPAIVPTTKIITSVAIAGAFISSLGAYYAYKRYIHRDVVDSEENDIEMASLKTEGKRIDTGGYNNQMNKLPGSIDIMQRRISDEELDAFLD